MMQINGYFEYLYATESMRLTSKWEAVAVIIIVQMKDCKEPHAVTALAHLGDGDGNDRTQTIAGNKCSLLN
jgi:hypothetical protein